MGNSGMDPGEAGDCRFVADVDPDRLDVEHPVVRPGDVIGVSIATTRYVGEVDPDGFLLHVDAHTERGTLAPVMLLTIRANISAPDFGGILGKDGLDVVAYLHKDTDREVRLGPLIGTFSSGWETFHFDVSPADLHFPDDPCSGQDPDAPCGQDIRTAPNEVSFEFTGTIRPETGLTFEVDWLTLEPKGSAELAWRPVLLVHGWDATAADLLASAVWPEGLALRDVAYHVPDVDSMGTIAGNAGQLATAVADTRRRFGVERVHVVAHSKGGIDTREYLKTHDDVDTLIMIASPNDGCFMADVALGAITGLTSLTGTIPAISRFGEMTTIAMRLYNLGSGQNPRTRYVAVAGDYDSPYAQALAVTFGTNDELVAVSSVIALRYAQPEIYRTSVADEESQTVCLGLLNHSCLMYNKLVLNQLFQVYLTPLQPSQELVPSPRPRLVAAKAVDDGAPVLQALTGGADLVPAPGDTRTHAALVDAVNAVHFVLFTDGDVARLEVISPSGRRIDASTPQTDPAVVHTPPLDAGPFWYTAYQVQAPEVGTWTLEVIGTGGAPETAYAVSALAQAPPGSAALLTAAVDAEQCAIGDEVTITATLTAAGTPVTGASVRALIAYPDGVTTEELALTPAAGRDGEYTGALSAVAQPGRYDIVVSADSAQPAFTRRQLVQLSAAPSRTAFTGEITDRGVDDDGDGRYDRLVVDVGVEVDVAAAYRVLGTLTDSAGTALQQAWVEGELAAGPQTVSLEFDGAALFAGGADGPYLVDDLVIEDVVTATALARAPAHSTSAYLHSDFQRPALLLTGAASDRGTHDPNMDRLPYEHLLVEVEVDSLALVEIEATANLHTQDGTLVTAIRAVAELPAGLSLLPFQFSASQIFRTGLAGPYELRLLSVWGTTTDGVPVSLRADGTVAITSAYDLEDFAPSPRYTVGGAVTGLIGVGQLELEISAEGPPGTPATFRMRPGNGPFTFAIPQLVSGNPYTVRVTRQPSNPVQICTVTNASGTIEEDNVTNVSVQCV